MRLMWLTRWLTVLDRTTSPCVLQNRPEKRSIRLNFYVFEIDSAGHSHSDKDTSLTIIYIVSKDETVDPKKK